MGSDSGCFSILPHQTRGETFPITQERACLLGKRCTGCSRSSTCRTIKRTKTAELGKPLPCLRPRRAAPRLGRQHRVRAAQWVWTRWEASPGALWIATALLKGRVTTGAGRVARTWLAEGNSLRICSERELLLLFCIPQDDPWEDLYPFFVLRTGSRAKLWHKSTPLTQALFKWWHIQCHTGHCTMPLARW